MENNEIYEKHTTDTLNKIKHLRNAQAPRSLENDVDELEHLKFFNIGGEDYQNYSVMVDESEKYSYKMLQNIILELLVSYKIFAQAVRISANVPENVFMIIGEYSGKKVLFVFKRYGLANTILQNMVSQVMAQFKIADHKYVSLVDGYAYAVQFDHNDDVLDPSRGTNIYSLKWFFETYFGLDEYKVLKRYVDKFTDDIRNYFGISVVRSLTLNALFSFKKTVTYVVKNFSIKQYVSQNSIENGISDEQIKIIDQQYFEKGFYKAITSKCDFAESLITAEWLYDSLKKAGSIDLTAVAMGYFKAIEQLLYGYILLHKKDGRNIHRRRGSRYDYVCFNDENIKGNEIDTTLGALIGFFNNINNKDLLKEEINEKTHSFIIDKLYKVKSLRNGYFHRDILNDWIVVEESREKALTIFYLILGAYRFSDSDKQQFQIPSMKDRDDYFALCEFTNLHASDPYYIDMYEGKLELYFSSQDDSIVYDEYGSAKYSGVYFRKPVGVDSNTTILPVTDFMNKKIQPGDTVKFDMQDFQNAKIYIGRMTPVKEGVEFSGPERLIYEDGRFIEIDEDKKPEY